MRKTSRIKKVICLLAVVSMLMMSTTAYAVWWATPGYEWALANKLTPVKTTSQLNQNVSVSDFYTTVIKYLRLKGVTPRNETIYHNDDMEDIDNIAKGIFEIINGFNNRNSLTIQDYYKVENYVKHGKQTLEQYKGYSYKLTTQNLKNINLYLDLSQYKAATLIGNRSDREYILAKLGNIKNAEILNYHILPYAGEITRKEFLVVMYDLLSSTEMSEDAIIKAFNEAGVLIGFDTGLELDKRITYSEMLTFLYRFEIFDFEPNSSTEEIEE